MVQVLFPAFIIVAYGLKMAIGAISYANIAPGWGNDELPEAGKLFAVRYPLAVFQVGKPATLFFTGNTEIFFRNINKVQMLNDPFGGMEHVDKKIAPWFFWRHVNMALMAAEWDKLHFKRPLMALRGVNCSAGLL